MADNLIFPIGFDLEKGVKDAQAQMDSALRRLQKTADGKPLTIPMSLDASKFTTFEAALRGSIQHITDDAKNLKAALNSSLQTDNSANINRITEAMRSLEAAWKALPNNQKFDINDRLTPKAQEMVRQFNELATASSTYGQTLSQIAGKIKRAADEEVKANQKRNDGYAKLRKTLGAQENSIANLSAKIKAYQQILDSKEIGSRSFERVAEKIRKLTEQLDKAKSKVAELTGKAQSGASGQATAVSQVSHEFKNQETYVSRLIKRMAVYASFSYAGNFLTSIREVTAQFELQRVSLGAILQDQAKAEALFGQIKGLALESPVSVLDLTKYTKQLAAYKIGYDELFETTKRLTDVSVGLGVSMDRIILAYGQIRAAGYLRACLGAGTRVKMYDGSYKNVEDVVVGDVLMGDDEQPRHVSKLYQGEQQMYRVSFKGGEFRCNEHHILTVYDTFSKRVSDVFVLDYLKEPLRYQGVRRINGEYKTFFMKVEKDAVDTYYGFSIDGNHRFIIHDDIVTHNTEVRQLTEAGIPIVEELAKKISDANGELVTSAKVMDMISKREIPFEMVADVFEDMTDKGGIFYNMQEKQADTLYGMWQKLGDAASIMYAEIGNVGPINSGMKTLIEVLRSMMKHWNVTAVAIMAVAGAMVKMKIASMNAALVTAHQTTAHATHIATLRTDVAAQEAYCRTVAKGSFLTRLDAQAKLAASRANLAAAQSNNVLTASFYKLKAAMLSNPYTLVITALLTLGTVIYEVFAAANELDNKFEEIDAKYAELSRTAPKNFEKLADAAVHAADGSKKQKDALDELKRTYGEMLPAEALQIENLRALGGAYEMLTNQVKAYYEQQRHEERVAAIKENWAKVIREEKDDIEDRLANQGASEKQIATIMDYIDEAHINGEDLEKALKEGAKDAGFDKSDLESIVRSVWNSGTIASTLRGDWSQVLANTMLTTQIASQIYNRVGEDTNALSEATGGLSDALAREDERFQKTINTLNKYHEMVETITARTADIQNREGTEWGWISSLRFETDITKWDLDDTLDLANAQIEDMGLRIKGELEQAGITVQEGWFEFGKSVKEGGTLHGVIDFPAIIEAAVKAGKTDLAVAIKELQPVYQQIAPSDETVRGLWAKVQQIGRAHKLNAATIKSYSIQAGESLSKYRKRLEDEEEQIADSIAKLTLNMTMLKFFGDSTEASEKAIAELKEKAAAIKEILGSVGRTPPKGHGSDPRLQNLKEEISLTKKLYDEYQKLEKQIGATQAKSKIQEYYANTIADLEKRAKNKYGFTFALPFTDENLKANIRQYISAMEKLQKEVDKKGRPKFPTIGKEIDEAKAMLGAIDTDSFSKRIEKQLKELADRISRTKTAKEFYEKILGMTGNKDMAARLATSIFGENGDKLNKEIAERLRKMVEATSATLPDFVFNADMSVNAKTLRGWVEANKTALGDVAKELTKFADEAEKDTAKMVENWLKATEKAKTYGDKLADVYRTTATEISRIETEMAKGNIGREEGTELIAGYRRKEAEDIAKLQYEAFKDSPLYVQMFDDLDHASTRMLENMKSRLESMRGAWRNLDPTQLKEMQSRLREIDEQLAKRNPFKMMADGLREYTRLRTKGDARGNRNRKSADEDAAEWAEKNRKAQEELAKIMSDPTATEAQIAGARQMVDYTKRQKDEAERVAENWKKVEDAIGLSANQLMSMLNWAGDIAKGIADISEAMGADEEDVQYWNDVADALGQISGGIQDIVSEAMSGNVTGIISSTLTAIPKMFVGFTNLFSAGKIKRANKEIKRQQKLLDQLEYTYGRLENAADKLFGRDYVNNYNQQLKNLQAQQTAYLKQAEAERSKGKKKDKEKIKEYENAARETADKIKELQDDLVAHFTGSTKTDVARQMAKSWIDARASMSDTFAAIKGDYQDLIKNMLVEGAAARVIENALTPVWDSMEKMLAKNDVEGAIDSLVNGMDSALNAANNGMEVLWKALEARGYDMKSLISDTDSEYTGIAKNVAGATSEEINTAAAIGNTLMYYVSPIPRIDENLARVVAIMEGRGVSAIPQATSAGWTDWQQQAMDNYQAIARNTADTVVECRRAAEACERIASTFKVKGATKGLNVFLNS